MDSCKAPCGWETTVNVGYAGRNAPAMRSSLVRMIEKKLHNSLTFAVYAAVEVPGADADAAPELDEVKVGEVKAGPYPNSSFSSTSAEL